MPPPQAAPTQPSSSGGHATGSSFGPSQVLPSEPPELELVVPDEPLGDEGIGLRPELPEEVEELPLPELVDEDEGFEGFGFGIVL